MNRKKRRPAAILPETDRQERTNEQIVQMIQDGEDAHGELMLQLLQKNKGFCFQVARPFLIARSIESEELQSISFIALCAAVDYFQTDAGASFLYVLKPFLLRELILASNCSAPVGLPVNLRTMLSKYKRFCSQYQTVHGCEPSDKAVLAELRITEKELKNLKIAERSQLQPVSLNAYITDNTADSEDGEACLLDALPDNNADTADAALQHDLCAAIRNAVTSLPDQERKAVEDKFFYNSTVTDAKSLRSGMQRLRTPAAANKLRSYIYSEGLKGTSLKNFNLTWNSATERAAIQRSGERQ